MWRCTVSRSLVPRAHRPIYCLRPFSDSKKSNQSDLFALLEEELRQHISTDKDTPQQTTKEDHYGQGIYGELWRKGDQQQEAEGQQDEDWDEEEAGVWAGEWVPETLEDIEEEEELEYMPVPPFVKDEKEMRIPVHPGLTELEQWLTIHPDELDNLSEKDRIKLRIAHAVAAELEKSRPKKSLLEEVADLDKEVQAAAAKPPTEEELKTIDSLGLEAFKIFLKRDEELDALDKEYKKAMLGGVSKELAEGAVLNKGLYGGDALITDRYPDMPVSVPLLRTKQVDENGISYGVARRKSASARVFVKPGTGLITVNGRDHVDYFDYEVNRAWAMSPFVAVAAMGKYDCTAFVSGGGLTGQAGAFRRAAALALRKQNPEWSKLFRDLQMLRADPRKVERKKYGQPKARKKFPWVKR